MPTKHKVFISYYHKDDEKYREKFEDKFGDIFINKSVEPGDIDEDLSAEYIKHLINEGYISDSSVIVVLVGKKTYCRKYVDWEISAALNKKAGGYSGLLALCLPTRPDYNKNKYSADTTPPRLVDNIKSGYAKYYDWTIKEESIKKWVKNAFKAKEEHSNKIDNSRKQMGKNGCE